MSYTEIKGDLIELAKIGKFDVVAHGVNCFCTMGAGIAPKMAAAFGCDTFPMEVSNLRGDINKLGTLDYRTVRITKSWGTNLPLTVVNAYTQYNYGKNHIDGDDSPIDYEALTLCLRKLNKTFSGKWIGLPQIGCGLAGGDWKIVKEIIQKELRACHVIVVIYDGKTK